jgi:hypothetical protein
MRSFAELESLWSESAPAPRGSGAVRLIVLRKGDGVHETPPTAQLSPEQGVHGDQWAREEDRKLCYQVTLMNARVAELIAADEQPLNMPGDNFLVDMDLSEAALPVNARLRIGTALLAVAAGACSLRIDDVVVAPDAAATGPVSTPVGDMPKKQWVCRSTSPGVTMSPPASTTSRACRGGICVSMAAMVSPLMARSALRLLPLAGSRTSPPRMRMSYFAAAAGAATTMRRADADVIVAADVPAIAAPRRN